MYHNSMAMATRGGGGGGGGRRRLLIPQNKVWRQVIRKDTEVQQASMDEDIPNDVVFEILLRLPAKSLVRLRWACKYLFDLVTRNPNFAKMHVCRRSCSTITTTNHDDDDIFHITSPSILSTSYKIVDCNKLFQCYLNYNDTTRVANVSSEVSIALPFYCPTGCRPQIIDPCNGLILLYKQLGNDWSIWNPCTKEYIILPPPLISTYAACREEGNTANYDVSPYHTNYGFGYDHTNDDYKVIRYSYYKLVGSNNQLELYSDVQVYTLGTSSWRRIGSASPYGLCASAFSLGVFWNGALYWVDYLEENIICFDIGTEKFRHVSEIPNLLTTGHRGFHCPKIYRLEGSICCTVKFKNLQQKCSEMWVMKDYAVNNNESLWTELSTIPFSWKRILLLKYTRNGEILMLMNHRDLILYDPKNNNPKTLCKLSKKFTHTVSVVYTESLISLNSGTFTGQEQRMKTNSNNKNKKK